MKKSCILKTGYTRSITIGYKVENKQLELCLIHKIVDISIKYELYFHSDVAVNGRFFYISGISEENLKSAYKELQDILEEIP